jgi:hypothetical protein
LRGGGNQQKKGPAFGCLVRKVAPCALKLSSSSQLPQAKQKYGKSDTHIKTYQGCRKTRFTAGSERRGCIAYKSFVA